MKNAWLQTIVQNQAYRIAKLRAIFAMCCNMLCWPINTLCCLHLTIIPSDENEKRKYCLFIWFAASALNWLFNQHTSVMFYDSIIASKYDAKFSRCMKRMPSKLNHRKSVGVWLIELQTTIFEHFPDSFFVGFFFFLCLETIHSSNKYTLNDNIQSVSECNETPIFKFIVRM